METKNYTYEAAMQRIANELRTARQEWNHHCIGKVEGLGYISCIFWCTESPWRGKAGVEICTDKNGREHHQYCIQDDLTEAQAISIAQCIDKYYEFANKL